MATFSGFKTQSNEMYYDQLVFKMIQLLSYKVSQYGNLADNIL
jgi:hypothetical protein